MLKSLFDGNPLGRVLLKESRDQVLRIIAYLKPTWLIKVDFPIDDVFLHFIFIHRHKWNNSREKHMHYDSKTPDIG